MHFAKLIVCSVVVVWGGHATGDEPTAKEVLDRVASTYESLDTYRATGRVTMDMDTGQLKVKQETSFSILLKKPNLFLITWEQNGPTNQSGAVWSDGTQPFLYMSVLKAYSQMTSDEVALGGATGISGGAAFTVPSIFLTTFDQRTSPLARLKNVRIEESEKIDGDDCFVIRGSSAVSNQETFWISKASHLIRQSARSLEPPVGGNSIPELTDQQIEESIKALGQEVTEERKNEMKQMMDRMRKLTKTMTLTGSSMETHFNIASPELTKADFKYSPPEGTALKENLLGSAFGGTLP